MSNKNNILDGNQIHQDSATTQSALSAHERAIFEQFLEKRKSTVEQSQIANDADHTSLSYLFGIFH